MAINVLLFCQLVALATVVNSRRHDEPVCTSRFDFEEKLLQKMIRLEHSMELLQAKVDTRLSELDHEKYNFLQTTKTSMEQLKTEQDGALNSLKEARAELENSLNDFMGNKEETLNQKIMELTEVMDKQGPTIVFSVSDAQATLVNGVPIFNNVLTNEGTAYDVKTGVFTAPYDGIYMFTLNVRSKTSSYCYCYIRINGSGKGYAISNGRYDMGAVTLYFKLRVSDKVDLGSCTQWNNVYPSGTAFSGQLINKL